MAGGIVSYVLGKLAEVAIQEALSLYKVTDKAEAMKRELKRIECFLKDADTKPKGDERVQNWVKEIRDLAFKIEDAFDTFLVNIGNPPVQIEKPRKRDFVKRMLNMTAKLPALYDYGTELDKIKSLIDEISERRNKYGIMDLGEDSSEVKGPVRCHVIPEIDKMVIVGFEADKRAIRKQLLDENTSRRSVVSIVGQGGLGKTTLAVKVYNSFGPADFDIKIWVTISEQFKLIDLLTKTLKKINPTAELPKEEEDLIIELFTSLQNKKYLIVMDDVWTEDLWKQIEVALPDDGNNSRVLVTSRFANVAKAANPINKPYELPLLNHTDSLNLFLKIAIPKYEGHEDLSDLANKFANKCGGLPLALVVLGGFLSTKEPTYIAWDKVYQTMNWQDEGKVCTEIIATSYADLPYELKSCFMYFALFPEDYRIKAKSLIRMWVAEGFIPEKDKGMMEDMAECYLEELVQRSMVQVTKRYYNGSIKYCHIHDLLRDLAIRKANECNFISVLQQDDNHTGLSTVRRASINVSECDELMQHTNPNLRTLLCLNSLPNFSRFKLLRVLAVIGGYPDEGTSFDNLLGLTQLRYFMSNYIDKDYAFLIQSFEAITHMKNIQTLDLSYLEYCNVPDCLWDVKILRHVILPREYRGGPPGSADLKYLQTLINVVVQKSWHGNLPNLPNLRELELRAYKPNQHKILAALLSRLDHLVKLSIQVVYRSEDEIEMYKMSKFPSYEHMHSLCLEGSLSLGKLTFDTSLFPIHLTKLMLCNSFLELDPMPVLEKLNNLKKLYLNSAHTGKEMTCSRGFPQLKNLVIFYHEKLENWVIMEGAMPVLQKLTLSRCHNVRVVGLNRVTTLQEFSWTWERDPSDDQKEKSEAIQNQIKHVPTVNFHFW